MKRHPVFGGRVGTRRSREGGFSLVEVALALMVAAGGMVAVFGLFPASMRQSVNARTDMKGALFASTVLETIAGNVRQIDDIAVWNDPEAWWDVATSKGFGHSGLLGSGGGPLKWSKGYTAEQFRSAAAGSGVLGEFSPATTDVAVGYPKPSEIDELYRNSIRYFGREKDTVDTTDPVPPQYLIRFEAIKRKALGKDGQALASAFMPNLYLVSVVSSPKASPQIFVNEQIYAQEYYFVHRP